MRQLFLQYNKKLLEFKEKDFGRLFFAFRLTRHVTHGFHRILGCESNFRVQTQTAHASRDTFTRYDTIAKRLCGTSPWSSSHEPFRETCSERRRPFVHT